MALPAANLVHSNLLSVYAGVSKQDISLRLPNHCEEMINAYPTVQYGLKRRNPTVQLSSDIITEIDEFIHSYDRGLSGNSSEQYVITIDRTNGIRVLDIIDNTYKTVTLSASALDYLESSDYARGFSATTVQDTTFIVNKDIIPTLGYSSGNSGTWNTKIVQFDVSGFTSANTVISELTSTNAILDTSIYSNLAPARIKAISTLIGSDTYYAETSVGATIEITIDAIVMSYSVNVMEDGYNIYPESIYSAKMNMYKLMHNTLNKDLYEVSLDSGNKIIVKRKDGASFTASSSVDYPTTTHIMPPLFYSNVGTWDTSATPYNIGATAITSITASTTTGNNQPASTNTRDSFIWIKTVSIDTSFPYTYTCTLTDSSGAVIATHSYAGTTSDAVAANFATWANGVTGFTATSVGSVCRIRRTLDTEYYINMRDTWGSQASVGFKYQIENISDVPRHFPYKDTVLKVGGVQGDSDIGYWINYNGNTWTEWYDPSIKRNIVRSTMPHKLVRNSDFTFTLTEVEYDDMIVGDNITQATPVFINTSIRDVFFIGGRLGLLSPNGISLAQIGSTTNFYRSTTIVMTDDSAITTYINSVSSVGLEFAVELQNVLVLFGDKQQFGLDATKPITPSTIIVQPISSYEIYKGTRPVQNGDGIMFIVNKGGYIALLEMTRSSLNTNVKADDVSSHIPNYIKANAKQIVGSQQNNAVFILTEKEPNTLYVYKYLYQDSEKIQQAWSKWTFNMDINSVFTIGRYLYIFGMRYSTNIPTENYTFYKVMQYTKNIDFSTTISFGDITTYPTFERVEIDVTNINSQYKDIGEVEYNTEIELSEVALSNKDSGKEIRGSLLLKTLEVNSADGSSFNIKIDDIERGTSRTIPALYTVNRKPFISGNAKNMRISILSDLDKGFQIGALSIESQYNSRSISR